MTSRTWIKPPAVYDVAIPSAHSTSRITHIVQSILLLLIGSSKIEADHIDDMARACFGLVNIAHRGPLRLTGISVSL
jgi:hypothetical protein